MLLPQAWLSDCATSRFTRFMCCALLDLFVRQIKQPSSRLRTMLFSVQQQARITLSHQHFLGLALFVALALIWWAFIPSAWRLAVELQHARPRSAKDLRNQYGSWTQSHSSFRSPGWDKEFLVPSMASALRMHLILFVGLDSDDEKQKAESRNWPASGQPS